MHDRRAAVVTAGQCRVLLVEDEDLVSMLTEDMLTDLGYEVGEASPTLEAGLSAAATGEFDVAVLDVNLRGLESYPIADILLERGIPFVFASGYGLKGQMAQYRGILTLQKPFTADALGRVLTKALANSSPQ